VTPCCILCKKFRRSCVYEKQTRTPLTRRYLSQVESELARTKALLLQFTHKEAKKNDGEFNEHLSEGIEDGREDFQQHTPSRIIEKYPSLRASSPQESVRTLTRETDPRGTSGLSLETPPSSNSFEWDERTGKPNGDRFVDGMASLASDANEGGYLGISNPQVFFYRLTLTILGRGGIWRCATTNDRYHVDQHYLFL
jgi:hypothetical protein